MMALRVTYHDVSCIAIGQLIYAWVMSAYLVRMEGWWEEPVSLQTSWSSLEKTSATRSRTILPLKSPGRLRTKVFLLKHVCHLRFLLERAGSLVPIYIFAHTLIKSEGFHSFESLLFTLLGKPSYHFCYLLEKLPLSFQISFHNAWVHIDQMPRDGCVLEKYNSVCFLLASQSASALPLKISTINILYCVCSHGLI